MECFVRLELKLSLEIYGKENAEHDDAEVLLLSILFFYVYVVLEITTENTCGCSTASDDERTDGLPEPLFSTLEQ